MSTFLRRPAATLLLVALFAGACGSDDEKKASPAGGAAKATKVEVKVGGVYSPAADLRADLTRLLQEHVFLSGISTDLLIKGKDPAPVAAVLDVNTAALGETFGRVYDDAVAQRFIELWHQKMALWTQFAQATAAGAAGNQEALTKVKADLEVYKINFALFFNETNPQLAEELLATDAGTHVNGFLSVVTAQSKKDPLVLEKLRDAAAVMPRTSAVFAAGIVKQMPKTFAGTADGGGATLLATITAALQEHVYLLGLTSRAVVAGEEDKKLRETLDENAEGLANLVGAIYGDGSARKFLRVWRSHITSLLAYAEAALAKDAAAPQKVAAELAEFRTALGALLDDLNPNLPQDAVAADFEDFTEAMTALVTAQAAADPAEFQRLHEAAATTPLLGELLAGAIAKQFDTKFS